MKALIFGLFLLLAGVQLSFAQSVQDSISKKKHTKAEQEIINLSKAKWDWMADKKVDTLSTLFHEKSMFVHMGGSWGKGQEIDVIKSGRIWYKKAEVYSASVNIIGNTAILLNDIDLVAVVGGNEVANPFMVTEVYIKEKGAWKMGSLTFSRLVRPLKIDKKLGLEKLWESDSTTLKGPESVLYDSASNSLYVSSMNAGTIVRMDTSGKVIQKDWVTGLTSNKGSALYNGLLYTAETAAVAVIDVKKGLVVKRIPVEGAVMLNDVAVDSKGILYVTDTRAGKVYRIEGDQPAVYLENQPGANGLLTVNSDLYVATSTKFLKVDDKGSVTTIADGFESGLDGIVMLSENEFIISNYKGILYHVKGDGTKQLLLDTRTNGLMANDISYNSKTKTLYVPSFSTNRVIAYKIK
ncbi:SMP-30/gluconolactonase/LRE family protein [Flavisolibacter sp. BT320]|nr:SMP-30/gluconolactonase/LRE family protein [Flavisolibacter longurius]